VKNTKVQKIFGVLAVMAAFSSQVDADVLNVPGDYPTIDDAISAAVNGDTIRVGPGTYPEGPLVFLGKSIVLESSDGPELTVITCASGVESTILFIRSSQKQNLVELNGFTISGGVSQTGTGGGVRIIGENSQEFPLPTDVRINDCIFLNNTASERGGGVYASEETTVTLTDCVFRGNSTGGSGGGAALDCTTDCEIRRCRFEGNTATEGAGALQFGNNQGFEIETTVTFLVESSVFTGNVASQFGGAVVGVPAAILTDAYCGLVNCTFSGNVSPRDPAVHTSYDITKTPQPVPVTVLNSIISNNAGIQRLNNGSFSKASDIEVLTVFDHCLFDVIIGEAPISTNNLLIGTAGFVDEFGPDGTSGTGDEVFTLTPLSSAIDQGLSDLSEIGQSDVNGDPRLLDDPLMEPDGKPMVPVDLGATEYDLSQDSGSLAIWDQPGATEVKFLRPSNWYQKNAPARGLDALVRTPGVGNTAYLDAVEIIDDLTIDGGATSIFASVSAPSGTGLYLQNETGDPGIFTVEERAGEFTRLDMYDMVLQAARVRLSGGNLTFSNVNFQLSGGNINIEPGTNVGLYTGTTIEMSGTITPTMINRGNIQASEAFLNGNFSQIPDDSGESLLPAGSLAVAIGPDDDRLSVPALELTGSAFLGGTLAISGSDDGLPSIGTQIPIIRASGISDSFQLLVAKGLPDAVSVQLTISESAVGGSSEAAIETAEATNTVFSDAFFDSIAPDGIEDAILADVDNDGDDDLIISLTNTPGQFFTHVGYLENLGTTGGTWDGFAPLVIGVNSVKIGGSANGLAVGDIDADGLIDAVVTNRALGTVHLLKNTSVGAGTIEFTDVLSASTSDVLPPGTAQPTDAWIGDIDLDGLVDVVVNNFTDGSVVSFKNTSTFAVTLGSPISSSPNKKIRRISPTGTGKIRDEDPFGVGTEQPNSDGEETEGGKEGDDAGSSGNVQVGKTESGLGSSVRLVWSELAVGEDPIDSVAKDLNSDGYRDIVTANRAGESISILFGMGAGNYESVLTIPVGSECLSINLGDFDGDGDPDIAVLVENFSGGSSVRVLRNDTVFAGIPTFCLENDSLFEGSDVNSIKVGRLDDDSTDDILVIATNPALMGAVPGWMASLGGLDTNCFGDLDGNGQIDAVDLAYILGAWGPSTTGEPADLNQDLVVDAVDLAFVLGAWGSCKSEELED
jgi:predicted outer membrane repeat protein